MIQQFQDTSVVKIGTYPDWVIIYVQNLSPVVIRLSSQRIEVEQQGDQAPGLRVAPGDAPPQKLWWKGDLYAAANEAGGVADFAVVGGS